MGRRKKPIWRNLLGAKFTSARTVFQVPETLPAHHQDLLKSCSRSRKKPACSPWDMPEQRVVTSGSQAGQAAGSGDMASSSTAALAPTGRASAPRGTKDLPSNTSNPELSLLRLVQLHTILQNITHEAILCPSPTGSYSWIFFRAHSQPQFSHLPVCQLFPSRSSLTSCAMPEITSLLPVPGARSSTLICPERLQPVPGTLPTGCFPKQAYPSVPNANLLIQLLAALHFLIHFSFSIAPLPSLLHVSKPLLPKLSFLHFTKEASFCFICQLLQTFVIFQLPEHATAGSWVSFTPPAVSWIIFLLPMLYCDFYPPKCKQPANPSQSRLQPQNKWTGWCTSEHGKMDCKYFRKQQEPKWWGRGELLLHRLSHTKGCILTPYLWSRQQAGMTPHTIHPHLATLRMYLLITTCLAQQLSFALQLLPQRFPDRFTGSMHNHRISNSTAPT